MGQKERRTGISKGRGKTSGQGCRKQKTQVERGGEKEKEVIRDDSQDPFVSSHHKLQSSDTSLGEKSLILHLPLTNNLT